MILAKFLIKTPQGVYAFSEDEEKEFLEKLMKENRGTYLVASRDATELFAELFECERFRELLSDLPSFDAEIVPTGRTSLGITIPAKARKEWNIRRGEKVRVIIVPDPDALDEYLFTRV